MKTTLILEIEHKKPIADLLDKAAGRIYNMDGVDNVTVLNEDPPELVTTPMPKTGWRRLVERVLC